jgi:NTP pyrophosphatase (non-canonical NTP hydrolase)
MGGIMDFNEYQELTKQTAKYPPEKAIEYLTLGIASEAGEVAGKVKKIIRDGGTIEEKRHEIMSEVGDVLWYIAQIGAIIGFSLEEIAKKNIEKLFDRKERNVIGGSGDNR